MSPSRRKPPRKFFDAGEQRAIVEAIEAAERRTSGEIRVHLEHHCKGGDAYARARTVFEEIGMTATAERNGVLVYVATGDGVFAVIGDVGIHEQVGPAFWDDVVTHMQERFTAGDFALGMTEAITRIGHKLAAHFPYAGDAADVNELGDEISFGDAEK
jgi:uncharacterized membrane protein